jgi:replicative DNA helicase
MDELFDKLKKQGKLPFKGENVKEAERAAMGCYILGEDIGENMKASAFTLPNHHIFYAIQEIKASGEKPEIAAIAGKLEKCGELERVGGLAALETLTDAVPTSANVRLYERFVLDAYRKREIFSAMCVAIIQFETEKCGPDEIINGMARKIDGAEWARDKA